MNSVINAATPAAISSLRNRWRTRTPSGTSPLPNVTDSSRKAAMGNMPASVNVDEPPLRDLNSALRLLVEVFPAVQPEVFREMLLNTSEESRLQMVTENLLRDEARCVRGRVRVAGARSGEEHPGVKTEERFRSLSYRVAVTDALSQEFKGLSRSAILAVLAECNHSYTASRDILLDLSSKSWRFSFTRFVFRRKTPTASEHPLVLWETGKRGSTSLLQPTLSFTPSTELNLELWSTLIQPILDKQKQDQERVDRKYAQDVSEQQAEALRETYECGCCFISYPMERLCSCTDQCHLICSTCIRHTTTEALFGQGWAKSIDHERCTVRCIASSGTSEARCEGFLPISMVQRALEEETDGRDLWDKVRDRCATESIVKSRLPLVRCPFCPYSELDDFDIRKVRWRWRLRPTLLAALTLLLGYVLASIPGVRFVVQRFAMAVGILIVLHTIKTSSNPLADALEASVLRVARKRRGLRFTCQSPRCGRTSCVNCHKAWMDIHTCFESSRLALRAAIEAATTEIVKRTCPACNLSFVKEAGCNKLTCVCGYTMCYVCRQEIGQAGYTHFCQHFRQRPGEPCRECEKCDLYKVEDEERTVREAALRAEREWWEREEREQQVASAGAAGNVDDADAGGARADGRRVVRDRLAALHEASLPLTSSGRLHAAARALGSAAKWERLLDSIVGEFVA